MFFGEYALYDIKSEKGILDEHNEPIIFNSKDEAESYKNLFGYNEDMILVPVNHCIELNNEN